MIYEDTIDPRLKIREVISSIEESYRRGLEEGMQRIRERDEREAEIEVMKENIERMKRESDELQQLSTEQVIRNRFLSQQIEESEAEAMQNCQVIQQMKIHSLQLQEEKQNFESVNYANCNQQKNANELENINEESRKKLEQNNQKVTQLQNEIEFSRERLEQLLKKYGQLKGNDRNIFILKQNIESDKSQFTKHKECLNVQYSLLQDQLVHLQSHIADLAKQNSFYSSPASLNLSQKMNKTLDNITSPIVTSEQLKELSISKSIPNCYSDPTSKQITDFTNQNCSTQTTQFVSTLPSQNALSSALGVPTPQCLNENRRVLKTEGHQADENEKKYNNNDNTYSSSQVESYKNLVIHKRQSSLQIPSPSLNHNVEREDTLIQENAVYHENFTAIPQRKIIEEELPTSYFIENLLIGAGILVTAGIFLYGQLKK